MKRAVILFNLGGPDSLKAVKPFLFNLFSDPAIISAPRFIRWLIALLISWRRAPIAQEIYQEMGGKSPILEQTEAQVRALEASLGVGYKVFCVMRYWHPRAEDVYKDVVSYKPEEVILLPLYPQYSSTTTGSSLKEWAQVQKWGKAPWKTRVIKSYPELSGLITYYAQSLSETLTSIDDPSRCRVLFSAHGLPEKVIEKGDPYQKQVIQTAEAIQKKLSLKGVDYLVTYQSRVGPLKWIDPYTDQEIIRAGHDKKHLIIVPLSFVSEHSETLVELDIEYAKLAEEAGVLSYHRIMTPQKNKNFIDSLAELVKKESEESFCSGIFPCIGWKCPKKLTNPKVCCLSR